MVGIPDIKYTGNPGLMLTRVCCNFCVIIIGIIEEENKITMAGWSDDNICTHQPKFQFDRVYKHANTKGSHT